MNSSWKSRLADLYRSLDVLKRKFADRDHYYHTIVFIENDPDERVLSSTPNNYAITDRLVDRQVVKLPKGGYHLHCTFDNNPDDSDHQPLRMLQRELATASQYLRELPKRRFPQVEVPAVGNGAVESWLHWLYMIHWLPRLQREFRHERPDLLPTGLCEVHFEFLDSPEQLAENEKFEEWEYCPCSNELDPRWVTIPTIDKTSGVEEWRSKAESTGRPAPQVVSASINKQLLLASWEAAGFMLQVADATAAPRNKSRKSSRQKGQLDDNALNLLHLLIKLHHCGQKKSQQRTVAFKLTELQQLMTDAFEDSGKPEIWSFSRTQRALTAIMSKIESLPGYAAAKKYKHLCSDGTLCKELDRLSYFEHKPSRRFTQKIDAMVRKLVAEKKVLEKKILELTKDENIPDDFEY